MQFTTALVALFASVAIAVPTAENTNQYNPCHGLNNAQCCSGDIAGIIGIDCTNPTTQPSDAASFQQACSSKGKQARCCLLNPILDLGLLCDAPIGVSN